MHYYPVLSLPSGDPFAPNLCHRHTAAAAFAHYLKYNLVKLSYIYYKLSFVNVNQMIFL